jgi:hypothetical protein
MRLLERFLDHLRSSPEGRVVTLRFPGWRSLLRYHPDLGFDPKHFTELYIQRDALGTVKGYCTYGRRESIRFSVKLLGATAQEYDRERVREALGYAWGSHSYGVVRPKTVQKYVTALQRTNTHWELREPFRSTFIEAAKSAERALLYSAARARWLEMVASVPEVWVSAVCNRLGVDSLDQIPPLSRLESLNKRFEMIRRESLPEGVVFGH